MNIKEKIIAEYEQIQDLKKKIEENLEIIKTQEDPALVSLAETEIQQFQDNIKIVEKELAFLEQESFHSKKEIIDGVIVEIRAGAGGEEAALFAADLFKMYSKYASHQGWRQKTLNSHQTELAGYKEIIFELKDGQVFEKMQYEAGVHRVQRVPNTEKSGRIHTSTASVAVLAKPKKAQIKINPQDLRIDTFRSSGPGGQNVNRRETAVRVTHLPTGLAVASQTERNQLQNKENALAILEAKLQALKEEKEFEKLGEKRKAQIKKAQRVEKIRTYNFPQDRVTDHRITKSFHNIEGIMSGNLDPIIEALDKFKE